MCILKMCSRHDMSNAGGNSTALLSQMRGFLLLGSLQQRLRGQAGAGRTTWQAAT